MKVSLAKVFEMIDFEAQVEPYLNNAARQFVSVNRLKERLVTIEEDDECMKMTIEETEKLVKMLKDDLQRHINTIGITNPKKLRGKNRSATARTKISARRNVKR